MNEKDIYRTAKLVLDKYEDKAEQFALNMMEEFITQGNTEAGATWRAIANAVSSLNPSKPSSTTTVH